MSEATLTAAPAWLFVPATGIYAEIDDAGRRLLARMMLECGKTVINGQNLTDEDIFTGVSELYERGLLEFFASGTEVCMRTCMPHQAPQLMRKARRSRADRRAAKSNRGAVR